MLVRNVEYTFDVQSEKLNINNLETKVDTIADANLDTNLDTKIDTKVDTKIDTKIDTKVDTTKVDTKIDTEILQQCEKLLKEIPTEIEEDLPLPSESPPTLPPRPKILNSSWETNRVKKKPCLRKSLKKIKNINHIINFTPNKVDNNNVPSMHVSILDDGSIV